jgi:hypothetical protein
VSTGILRRLTLAKGSVSLLHEQHFSINYGDAGLWAGCDDDEIATYSGHASKDMIRKYDGEARQIMRALQAREKRQ